MDIIAEICSVPIIRKGNRRINTGKTVKITAQTGKAACGTFIKFTNARYTIWFLV